MKTYLKSGDKVFSTGVYLVLDKDGKFQVDGFEDDTYFEGQLMNTNNKGYYVEDEK